MKRAFVLAVVLLSLAALLSAVGENNVASASHLDQVSTITVLTSISTLPTLGQVFNGPFTVLATTGTKLPCELWALNFNATTGQYLTGSINSDIPVSFFVVQQTSYQNWVKAGTCGNLGDAIAGQLLTTTYSINSVAIPNTGTWTIVIVNTSNARNADGYLLAYLSPEPYPVTQPLTGTIIMTTMTTTLTTSTALSAQPVPGFPLYSIVLGIIAGLIAVVMLRRRNHG